jgi:hypothetical protein
MGVRPLFGSLRARLSAWPRPLFAAAAAACALLVSATFYPPKTQYWNSDSIHRERYREFAFLKQCQDPFRRDVEPAVRWRLFPPVACHALGLTGKSAQAFCWAGLAIFTFALAARLDGLAAGRSWALLGTIGFATSGPFITAVGWLGLNDGWYLLALLEAAAGESVLALAGWAFVGIWTDERFLIGLPLALLVRRSLRPAGGLRLPVLAASLGCAPYAVLRIAALLAHRDAASQAYVEGMAGYWRSYAPFIPLGCLMGYRAGWMALGAGLAGLGRGAAPRLLGAGVAAASVALISALAWDLDRSMGILLPIFVLGVAAASRAGPRSRAIGWACLAANLALPYAHVVGVTVSYNAGPKGVWSLLADR